MAHFVELDANNVVLRVIVVSDKDTSDINGIENENLGIAFCKKLYGVNTNWKQTSYNDNIRKNYAGIGYTYREDIDAFVPKQPFPSWVLNSKTARWESPVPMPEDAGIGDPLKIYSWDEETTSWVEVQTETTE